MFTISLEQKARISAICNFASGKINPIYMQVRIEANNNQVTFSACNGSQYSSFTLDADVKEEVSYCVDSKRLSVVTTALAGDKAKFTLKDEDLFVTCGRSRLKLQTFSTSDYPNMETFNPDCRIECSIGQLTHIINQAQYCVANGDVRTYLCNLNWQINEDCTARICATDGHRLSLIDEQFSVSQGAGSFLVPTSFFQHVLSLKLSSDTVCDISFSQNKVSIFMPQFAILSTLGDGTYPNIDPIIPKDNSHFARFKLEEMMDLSKRVFAVAALEKIPTVKLAFDTNGQCELEVTSSNGDNFTDSIDLIEHSLTESVTIGINSKYLHDALSKQSGELVQFVLTTNGAIKITSDNENLTTLVMPVRV